MNRAEQMDDLLLVMFANPVARVHGQRPAGWWPFWHGAAFTLASDHEAVSKAAIRRARGRFPRADGGIVYIRPSGELAAKGA